MKILVVQPHRDDAVFSIAEHMLTWLEAGHELTIHTIFAGVPFDSGDDAQIRKHIALEREHRAAMKWLGAVDTIDSMYMDHGCGLGATSNEAIQEAIWLAGHDVVVAPVGIHHDDHIQVAKATAVAAYVADMPMWLYDELPYFVQYPELSLLSGLDSDHDFVPVGCEDHYEKKLLLTKCYASQIGRLEVRTLMAPERVWRSR